MNEQCGSHQTPDATEDAVQITSRDIARMLTMSVRTVWRLVAAARPPQPIRYNRKLVRWDRAAVLRSLEAMADRGGGR